MEPLVNVYRGDLLESFHSGSIAVVDSTGHLLAFAGDPSITCFLRSASKPFQAIPLLQVGGEQEFDLSAEEIALTCSSHGGEPIHVSTAAALLRGSAAVRLWNGPHGDIVDRRWPARAPSPPHRASPGRRRWRRSCCCTSPRSTRSGGQSLRRRPPRSNGRCWKASL